jgi:Epoxide hydrolase N terminus
MSVTTENSAGATAIRPFHIEVPREEIDGLDIRFAHIRSPHDVALPLLMTHGWPGSIIELLKVIEPLTNPTAHGGRAEDASTSSCRRCPATASRATRRRPAGARPGWRARSTS